MDNSYDTVRALAQHVRIPDLEPHQVYFGENYRQSSEPWAVKLQQDGAPFTWVAYSFGEIPMWQMHAGIVLVQGVAHVGFHCHKDAAAEYVDVVNLIGPELGRFHDSEVAREFQYNRDFVDTSERDHPEIGRSLGDIYLAARAELRRRSLVP